MKKLITIIVLLFTFTANAQIQLSESYAFNSNKKLHFGVASGMSAATFFTAKSYAMNATHGRVESYSYVEKIKFSKRAAIIFPTIPIIAKEMFDLLDGREISLADIVYGELGLILMAHILEVAHLMPIWRHKRQVKKAKKRFDVSDNIHFSLDNPIFTKN